MQNGQSRPSLRYVGASIVAAIAPCMVAIMLRWPAWALDDTVAAGGLVAAPMWLNVISGGIVGRWFACRRNRVLWLASYVFVMVAACSHRLGWPQGVMELAVVAAILIWAFLSIAAITRWRIANHPNGN